MEFENILIEKNDRIATVTINRPTKLNALNKATIKELNQAFTDLQSDAEVRAIVVVGSGEKAFVAGADISEFADFDDEQGASLAATGHELLFNFIENFSKPVIAAVNGFALGGGLELAMACHFRIASENAKMGLPEVTLGVIPGYGGTQRLPQLVGKGKAMEMILTAAMLTAEEAKTWGLVNHVVPQSELLGLARSLAAKIANNSPVAVAKAIETVNAGFDKDTDGFMSEIRAFGYCFGTEDFKEGTTAFLEKRKPEFTGK
ncbi:enoyl-CoA hydratase/isomerase family protein [Flavobacterium selenitireducens]|uniref:enoyl-CoA hydratase/isomerase family protein n=1 Tax=Flavobacterium selenitireducens TaxID=2722704 RepID=UPI00168B097B|nr:enoyl-CoA hydratase-related protein [Flavobacterium selenitireducens]MBD3581644.1 enoyl-CoA hydratase [Flavobacterium selenitireducens]